MTFPNEERSLKKQYVAVSHGICYPIIGSHFPLGLALFEVARAYEKLQVRKSITKTDAKYRTKKKKNTFGA